jgi:hypothetical protein
VIAASHIDMTPQPTWMKQGGEKAAEAGDPAFADSLKVAAKVATPEPSAVKGGRRPKTDVDDAKPMEGAHDGNALVVVPVLVQPTPPQLLVPTQPVSAGTAVTTLAAYTGATASGTQESVQPLVRDLQESDESGSVRSSAATRGAVPVAASAESDTNSASAGSAELIAVPVAGAAPLDPAIQVAAMEPRGIDGGATPSGAPATQADFSAIAGTTSAAADLSSSAAVPNAAAATVDQRAALLKAGIGPVASGQAASQSGLGKAGANLPARAKAGSKTGFKDGSEAKQADKFKPVTTEVAEASSADGAQRDGSSQAQGLTEVVAPVNHNAVAEVQAQVAPTGFAAHSATPSDVNNGHTVRTDDVAAPTAVAVAQPLPAINTARLIQSVGQSEMRVGMRSAEFGNISIRTSSTPELMSAEISVDHGDLARMLATHVPEIQAKLGGGQPVHVQVEMSGQNAGSHGGQANGSAADAQGSRRQDGQDGQGSRGSNGGASAQRYQRESLAVGLTNESSNTRLDVRV